MKKYIKWMFLIFCILWIPAVKAEDKIDVYLFYGDGCPHCQSEKEFLKELKQKYNQIEIHMYETWYSNENNDLMRRVKNALGTENAYVPYTVIGETGYTGYNENIGYQIEQKVEKYTYQEKDIVKEVIAHPEDYNELHNKYIEEKGNNEKERNEKEDSKVVVPLLGKVDAKTISLPILAGVIGLVDGFNPCAMWILLFLISMLLGMKNRKRMWILGITFLTSSALVYLLFMLSWLKVAMNVGSILFVRIIIAIVALVAGIVNLIKFVKPDENGCDIVDDKKRKKILKKIKKFTAEKSLILALVGIVTLAFSVNLVELACSAGLPLLFTQVLAMNDLSQMQYFGYILLYIFFFLLDDLIVFSVAMLSFQLTGFSNKYNKYSHLIGGIIMVCIGLLLLWKPEILMFNF